MGEGRNSLIDGSEISWHHCQDRGLCVGVERMCRVQSSGRQHWGSAQSPGPAEGGPANRRAHVPNCSCNSQVDHAAVFSGDSEDESGARDGKNTKDTKWDSNFPGAVTANSSPTCFQVWRTSNGSSEILILR